MRILKSNSKSTFNCRHLLNTRLGKYPLRYKSDYLKDKINVSRRTHRTFLKNKLEDAILLIKDITVIVIGSVCFFCVGGCIMGCFVNLVKDRFTISRVYDYEPFNPNDIYEPHSADWLNPEQEQDPKSKSN